MSLYGILVVGAFGILHPGTALNEPNCSGVSLDLPSAEIGASYVGVSDVLSYSSRS